MNIQLMTEETGLEMRDNGDRIGRIIWTLDNGVMVMNGTYVEEAYRGKDYAKQLLDHAADYARENNYQMQAVCPYIVKMFERSRAYDDVKTA